MKKKCIIIIAVVCVAVVAVAGTVFGVRAYNDYTLQQQTEERIKSIDDTYADFLDETDRSKKLEKLSDFIKNKPSTNDEIAVEVLKTVEPSARGFGATLPVSQVLPSAIFCLLFTTSCTVCLFSMTR